MQSLRRVLLSWYHKSKRDLPWRRWCVFVTLASFLGACAESGAYRLAKTDEAHQQAVNAALLGVGVQAEDQVEATRAKAGTPGIKTNAWDWVAITMMMGSIVLMGLAFRELTTVKPIYWKDVELGPYLWPAAGLAFCGGTIGGIWGWSASQPKAKP